MKFLAIISILFIHLIPRDQYYNLINLSPACMLQRVELVFPIKWMNLGVKLLEIYGSFTGLSVGYVIITRISLRLHFSALLYI